MSKLFTIDHREIDHQYIENLSYQRLNRDNEVLMEPGLCFNVLLKTTLRFNLPNTNQTLDDIYHKELSQNEIDDLMAYLPNKFLSDLSYKGMDDMIQFINKRNKKWGQIIQKNGFQPIQMFKGPKPCVVKELLNDEGLSIEEKKDRIRILSMMAAITILSNRTENSQHITDTISANYVHTGKEGKITSKITNMRHSIEHSNCEINGDKIIFNNVYKEKDETVSEYMLEGKIPDIISSLKTIINRIISENITINGTNQNDVKSLLKELSKSMDSGDNTNKEVRASYLRMTLTSIYETNGETLEGMFEWEELDGNNKKEELQKYELHGISVKKIRNKSGHDQYEMNGNMMKLNEIQYEIDIDNFEK